MELVANAALASWTWDGRLILLLLVLAFLYLRGWQQGRNILPTAEDLPRLLSFFAGLTVVFIALGSPLDTFDNLLLSVHMVQHFLLIMVAPPLVLNAKPLVPLLRGLPKLFVKEGLGPFLAWPALQATLHFITRPPVAWVVYTLSTLGWHVPALYELVLRSPWWHQVQHACFFWTAILFWWPVIDQGMSHSRWPRWMMIPYLVFADLTNTILAALFVFSGRVLYPTYEVLRFGNIDPLSDQTLAGVIMWVPGSIVYLVPAILIGVRVLSAGQRQVPSAPIQKRREPLIQIKPVRTATARVWLPKGRRAAQTALLVVAMCVIADGLRGPQVTGLNLAGVLPWIHWRALSLAALLLVGNLFCMACPFTLARDLVRKILPVKTLRWPHSLRTKWAPIVLLIAYLWAYEAFSLWNSPSATAWIIVGYFCGAIMIDSVFRGASFCKYVCPIGQFHFVTSLVSPSEIAVRDRSICESCQTFDCIRGNQHVRGCELDLFQPKKVGNLDCTFCMDCVKACPHDNVSVRAAIPGKTLLTDVYRSSIRRLSTRTDWTVLALVIVFGAFVNSAGMVGPVVTWEHRLHGRLGPNAMPWIVGVFTLTGVLVAPALSVAIAWLASRFMSRARIMADTVRRLSLALVPVGASMWAAHLLYHFGTSWSSVIPVINRNIGYSATQAIAIVPAWLTPAQILLLDAGLLMTLYLDWRMVKQMVSGLRRSVGLMLPWATLACSLYAVGVWILFQPMDMRGMPGMVN